MSLLQKGINFMYKRDSNMSEENDDNSIQSNDSASTSTVCLYSSNLSLDMEAMQNEENLLEKQRLIEEKKILKKQKDEDFLKERKERALKSMEFLLKNSKKYSEFFLSKLKPYKVSQETNKKIKDDKDLEYDEIMELQKKSNENTSDSNDNKVIHFASGTEQPKMFVGKLHPYQLDGIIWLKCLYENGVNGILADEMGLGKTIQVIAHICRMYEERIDGPYIIITPLSTIPNWVSEFKKFAPKIPIVVFHGNAAARKELYKKIQKNYNVNGFISKPVVLTSYQIPLNESRFLSSLQWQYIIIDEGHRIKNHECQLMRVLKMMPSLNRLLLTGTPLQNNLLELWSLLNFLLPQFFADADVFASLFMIDDFNETDKIIKQEQDTNIISTIHGVISPFMLRRLKEEVLKIVPKKEVLVYCHLTNVQREIYKMILDKNIGKVCGDPQVEILKEGRKRRKVAYTDCESDDEIENTEIKTITENMTQKEKVKFISQIKLSNPVMMLKRAVSHPYLIHFPLDPNSDVKELLINEQLIEQSGKMKVLDAMLPRLKKGGHKVLIFCTLVIMLDIIEDFLLLRKYKYRRLDGGYSLEKREASMKEFKEDPKIFIYLISTKAGGLGLNLTAADTVIFYDRDWNPQNDLQAQDRCHRIGQNKPVMVYSLVTKATIEERIISRANAKRRLEKIVIKKGKFQGPEENLKLTDLKELKDLLMSKDYSKEIETNGTFFTNEELKQLLDRSDLYETMKQQSE